MTGAAVALTSGDLVSAVLAGSAIPGVCPAVRRDGRVLYDGGVPANVPIRQALALGAEALVVLVRVPRSPADGAGDVGRDAAVLGDVEHPQPGRAGSRAGVGRRSGRLPARTTRPAGDPLDSGHTAELVASSCEASAAFLAGVEVRGPGLYGHPSGTY